MYERIRQTTELHAQPWSTHVTHRLFQLVNATMECTEKIKRRIRNELGDKHYATHTWFEFVNQKGLIILLWFPISPYIF